MRKKYASIVNSSMPESATTLTQDIPAHTLIKKVSVMSNNILSRQYSEEFDRLRKNRVAQSFYKYGPAHVNFGDGLVDAIGSLELCLQKFKETGNTEYLCDVANYAMFRFMFPKDGEHFRATSSEESAGTFGVPIGWEDRVENH